MASVVTEHGYRLMAEALRAAELDLHEPVTCAVDPCDEPATWHELCRVHAAEDHDEWRWTERDD